MPDNELNVNNEETFKNVDYRNKAIPKPLPDKITDIDVNGNFYSYVLDLAEKSELDVSKINSFTSISRSRDSVYTLLDLMAEDPTISSAIKIYAADVCEPNDKGQIVWCDCEDVKIQNMVSNLLDSLNIDKNSVDWTTSLIKYGDLYFRLYRESDFEIFDKYIDVFRWNQEEDKKKKLDENYIPQKKNLKEDLKMYDFSKNDKYAEYIEAVKNPAQIFDLQKFGKSYGYIKTTVPSTNVKVDVLKPMAENKWVYRYDQSDVELFEATEFVHACLTDNSSRTEEEVSLNMGNDDDGIVFGIKRGQSLLYNSFKIWRELSLLENAVLLNRITQSSVIRCVNVELSDTDQSEAKNILRRIKTMFEQKSAINIGNNMQDYTNAGPVQNTIYVPTHNGVGAITINSVGGDVQVGDLTDLDYWKNKLSGSLGIPKQYLGDTTDSTGFNGGTSLSLISSRYAKTVKSIQNIYVQAITDIVNLILLDKGLHDYINKFTLKMQAPTTQEEKDRRDNVSTQISIIQNVMNLLDPIQNPKTKMKILKAMLSDALNNEAVTALLDEEINSDELPEEEFDDLGGDLGGSVPMDLGSDELPSPDEVLGEEPSESGESTEMPETPPGEEGYNPSTGGEKLNEANDLPSFSDMGISYTDVR